MARPYLGTMEEFNLDSSNWLSYSERFTLFLENNEIRDAATRRNTLLTTVGGPTYDLLADLASPRMPHELTFEQLVDLLKSHFQPKQLTAPERFKFRQLVQQNGQTVSQFIAVLRRAASKCNFGNFLEESLRDQFIAGLRSEQARRRILAETDVNLARAVELAQMSEATDSGVRSMQARPGATASATVDQIQPSPYKKVHKRRFSRPNQNGQNSKQQNGPKPGFQNKQPGHRFQCGRCNSDSHRADDCKFKDAVCRKCQKKGHIFRACRSKASSRYNSRTHNLEASEDPLSSAFEAQLAIQHLTEINNSANHLNAAATRGAQPKMVSVSLNGHPTALELDTGSCKTLLNEQTWRNIGKPQLCKPAVSLISYSGHSLSLKGQCTLEVKTGVQSKQLEAFVVNGNSTNLLGREWLEVIRLDWSKIFPVNAIASNAIASLQAKYSEIFKPGLGKMKGIQAKIQLKPGSQPRFNKARPVPFSIRQLVENDLQRLEDLGVIEKVSHSEWAAPTVYVPKGNEKVRTCGDFRCTINPVMDIDKYPLPKPSELFHRLNGGEKFTKLDMRDAYLQLEVEPASRPLLTINTHRGLYRYCRLSFGISSAPAIYQKSIETVLQGLKGVCCYLDDLTVTGRNDAEHLENLEAVFRRLQEFGLRLNSAKCVFMAPSVEYLGFVIDKQGVRPSDNKVKAVVNMPAPSNVSEVRSFNGMVQHYASFIPSLSSLAAPINRLTQKDVAWNWGPEQQKAFLAIKAALLSMDCLVHYSPELPLTLACDASSTGVGAVLCHRYQDGSERPIAFASKSLSPTQRRYSQIEKEALSIIFGLDKFNQYIWGTKFTLITDHRPLLTIFSPSKGVSTTALSRLQRWAIRLGCYSYTIEFRPTHKHGSADGLSRLTAGPDEQFDNENASDLIVSEIQVAQIQQLPVDFKRIQTATRKDVLLAKVIQFVQQGWPDHVSDASLQPFYRRRDEITVENNVLLWGLRVVIPEELQPELIEELHRSHSGIVKMKSVARSHFWWPQLDSAIETAARQCTECATKANEPQQAAIQPWAYPSSAWSRIHIDFLGPVFGSTYLIIVDAFSKWMEVIEMSHGTSAAHTISALRSVFASQGLARTIVSDNGPPFQSSDFHDFCIRNGIEHKRIAPYVPASNGEAERAVQTFKSAMKPFESCRSLVKQRVIANFLLSYRSTPHATTGQSPAELLNKRQLRTRLSLVHPNNAASVESKQQQQVDKYNATATLRHFCVNDNVWARDYHGKNKWAPGKVVRVLGSHNYLVEAKSGDVILEWKRHVDQLRALTAKPPKASSPPATSAASETASASNQAAPANQPKPKQQQSPPRKDYPIRSRGGGGSVNKIHLISFLVCISFSMFAGAAAVAAAGPTSAKSTTLAPLAATTIQPQPTSPEIASATASPEATSLLTRVLDEIESLRQKAEAISSDHHILDELRRGLEDPALLPQRLRAFQGAFRYIHLKNHPPDPTTTSEQPTSPTTPQQSLKPTTATLPASKSSIATVGKYSPTSVLLSTKPAVNISSYNFTAAPNAYIVEVCKHINPTWAIVDQCKTLYYWLMATSLAQAMIIIFLIAKLCKSQCGLCNYSIYIRRNPPPAPSPQPVQLQPLLPPSRHR